MEKANLKPLPKNAEEMNISEGILYIGTDDCDIELFENQYDVPLGMSYNSYLIMDEKIAVMDTVDDVCEKEWIENLKAKLNGRIPDYLVVSHVEPDHSGCIVKLIEEYPDITLVGNAKTFAMLPQFYDMPEFKNMVVKEGDELSLGKHTLKFIMAPMVHWPEVMMSFEETEGVLFAADGFGKYGVIDEAKFIEKIENGESTKDMPEEEDEEEGWACEARRYYFNIVGKYGIPVQNVLKKAAGLDIKAICPLHGPVLKEDLDYYIGMYDTWSSYKPEDKGVLIAVASIHGNTLAAAEKFADMLREMGEEKVVVSNIPYEDMAEVVEDAFRYDRIVLAAASYDGGVFTCMETFLNTLVSKAYQNRTVGIIENGSWGPTAAKTIKKIIEPMKNITVLEPVVTIKTRLKEENAEDMKALAEAVYKA